MIAFSQAHWLQRHFPGYPPLRHDSAAYFAQSLDMLRSLETQGWRAIPRSIFSAELATSKALRFAGVLALLLVGFSYPDILGWTNGLWLFLLGLGVQLQARNLGWKGGWPWPALIILCWPSILGMAREFRTELPAVASTSLLLAVLLNREIWEKPAHTAGISGLLVLCFLAKATSSILIIPVCLHLLWDLWHRESLRRFWKSNSILIGAGGACIGLLLLPDVLKIIHYYGAFGSNYQQYGKELVGSDPFATGLLGRFFYYPANLLRTHTTLKIVTMEAVVVGLAGLQLRSWRLIKELFSTPLKVLILYYGFGLVVLTVYGVRTPAGDFSFLPFVFPLFLAPWVILENQWRLSYRRWIIPGCALCLLVVLLLESFTGTPNTWAGLREERIPMIEEWGFSKVLDSIQDQADDSRPIALLVLASHTVINSHTLRCYLLTKLGLERELSSTSLVDFYLPPAKGLMHPRVLNSTYILAKSNYGGPLNSWLSSQAGVFYTRLSVEPPFPVTALWKDPLPLPDDSFLQLFRVTTR